jgi:hypothetical protein
MRLTFAREIEQYLKFRGSGKITAAIITHRFIDGTHHDDPRNILDPSLIGISLTWEQARPLLDYKYNRGYGTIDCHEVIIYTDSMITYNYGYDGLVLLRQLPRSPLHYIP